MAELFESELIRSCIDGDRKSQKALYDHLAPRMFPVCIRYIGDRDQAADVLQDGFITLFTKLKDYKGEGSFEGWARRVFVTTALMSLRKRDALKMSEELDAVRGMKAETVSQTQNIGYKELMKVVTSLPPGFRTVFNMYTIGVVVAYSVAVGSHCLGIHVDASVALGCLEGAFGSLVLVFGLRLRVSLLV